MGVANGHGERIGRIVRRRQRGKRENELYHLLDLMLLGAAAPMLRSALG